LPSLEAIKIWSKPAVGVALVPKLTAQNEIASGRLKTLGQGNEARTKIEHHLPPQFGSFARRQNPSENGERNETAKLKNEQLKSGRRPSK
jgi:hypothetical protein